MSDFAPVDGRGVWATSPGVTGAGARSATNPVEILPRARGAETTSSGGARRIVDEVELSDAALSAQRPVRDEVIARARERIASGYYDQQGVVDRTIDRLSSGLIA